MTPHEALKLLDDTVAMLQVNRQTHARLVLAVKTLERVIEPKPGQEAESGNTGNSGK